MNFKKTCTKCSGSGQEIDIQKTVKFLRVFRKSNDITFRELADETNWSIGYLSDIENRQKAVSFDVLSRIHEALIKLADRKL